MTIEGEIKEKSNKFALTFCYCLWERKRAPTIPFVLEEQYLYREQYKKEAMNQFKKKIIQNLSKEVKSNNFCFCKVGRAITKWGAIKKDLLLF